MQSDNINVLDSCHRDCGHYNVSGLSLVLGTEFKGIGIGLWVEIGVNKRHCTAPV